MLCTRSFVGRNRRHAHLVCFRSDTYSTCRSYLNEQTTSVCPANWSWYALRCLQLNTRLVWLHCTATWNSIALVRPPMLVGRPCILLIKAARHVGLKALRVVWLLAAAERSSVKSIPYNRTVRLIFYPDSCALYPSTNFTGVKKCEIWP